MNETITWISVDNELPDAETEVLLQYRWRDNIYVDSVTYDDAYQYPWIGPNPDCQTLYWAEMPKGPE